MTSIIDLPFIAFAHQLASSAGEIAHRFFRMPLVVDNKADASPVTMADREVEATLRQLIEAQYPDHGIIGEEFGNVRPESPFQWVLDPIDGTHAFIAGQETFTTLIALAENTIPIFGLISQPILKECWIGFSGKTTLNGKPSMVRGCGALSEATIATTAMKYFTPERAAIFEKVRNKCAHVVFGGDAYLYAGLASGKVDIVVESGLKPYDFCALKPVIEGAGGIITDWQGKPITIHSDGCVIASANKELHKEALALINA